MAKVLLTSIDLIAPLQIVTKFLTNP